MTAGSAWPRDAELAYEVTAPFYDEFTAQYDYDGWFKNLLPKLRLHGLTGNRLLDVGCGTGKSFMPMVARGWQVTACDVSPHMLALARAKVAASVSLERVDMRDLPRLGIFDLVWALDDALNYLLSVTELTATLSGMRLNLAERGLICFDLNTLASYRTFFAQTEIRPLSGCRRAVWTGMAPTDVAPGSICEATLHVEDDESSDGRSQVAMHRERHFTLAEVMGALTDAGLVCVNVFGHSEDAVFEQPASEQRHSKIVFIAKGGDRSCD
jgi:SAM-dependent methyltransferase